MYLEDIGERKEGKISLKNLYLYIGTIVLFDPHNNLIKWIVLIA